MKAERRTRSFHPSSFILHPSAFILCAFALLLLTSGCTVHFHHGPLFEDIDPMKMPVDSASLLALSYASYKDIGPTKAIAVSLVAAEKVIAVRPDNELANYLAARACLWLLELGQGVDEEQAKGLANKGFDYAQAAVKADGDRGEYAFMAGSLLGYQLMQSFAPHLIAIRQVNDYFRQAAKLDPNYNQGAPLRALGTFLVKSPPWPTGVGDEEEGLTFLKLAVQKFPAHPANHMLFAEALASQGDKTQAKTEYEKVKEICADPTWGSICDVYGKKADRALEKLAGKAKP